MPATAERLEIFEGLRGLAIALVVTYHIWLVTGQGLGPLNYVARAGFLGVDLFFFISGFCLFYPYARAAFEHRPAPAVRHFFLRRACKIVPSYVLALAVYALVYRAHFASLPDATVQLASHLTFLHTLHPATFAAISGPLWTIGIEVQFYLLFPAIAPWFSRTPLLAYGVLVLAAESYRIAIGANGLGTSFWATSQLPAFLDLFGAGMLAAWLLVTLRSRASDRTHRIATWVSGLGFILLWAGLGVAGTVPGGADGGGIHAWVNAHRIAFGPLCLVLGVSSALALERWRTLVALPPLVFLSTISYNLYLWHLEIAVWLHDAGLAPGWTVLLSVGAAVAVAALVTYRLERPILSADLTPLRAAFARFAAMPVGAAVRRPSS
jgi:peptidoglycan/LPS O-acetylase OafA/YrhL